MFGEPSPEEAHRRAMSGESWEDFCDLLKAAGSVLQREGTPDDPLTRAEGLRYLTRLTRAALEAFVEHADPNVPTLRRMVHETAKMGNDNPDNHYLNAAIDGASRYRLHGHRGSVAWLEFATQKGQYGEARGMPPTGHLDAADMIVADDGTFEILVQADDPGPGVNWLRTEPDSGMLIVRQSWLDRSREVLPTLHLERLDGDARPSPLTPEAMDRGLRKASTLVAGAATLFATWAEDWQAHVNRLPRFDQALSDQMGGVPHIAYYHSYWRLADDEALVITATPPPCDHWNVQLSNHWLESLDYRLDPIHTNSAIAHVEPDGSIKVIVAHEDPGHPNWLRTQGHRFGAMCFRWVRPGVDDPPEPRTEVVKLATLR